MTQFPFQLYCFGKGDVSGRLGLARGNGSSVLASEALPFNGLSDIIIAETGSHLTVALSSRLQVHGCNFSASTAPLHLLRVLGLLPCLLCPYLSSSSFQEPRVASGFSPHDFHPRRSVFFFGFFFIVLRQLSINF